MTRETTGRLPVSYGPHDGHMTEDRLLVGMGVYDGISASPHYGTNLAIDTTFAVISALGQAKPMRFTAADTLDVSSSSTEDAAGQTGALTIEVEGLDADYATLKETVTMNGTTDVTTTGLFLHVNGVKVLTSGSNKTNVGDIYVRDDGTSQTSGVPDSVETTFSKIRAGYGVAQSIIFTVPAGFTCFLMQIQVLGVAVTTTKPISFRGHVYNPTVDLEVVVFEGVLADYEAIINRGSPNPILEKSTVWADAKAANSTSEVSILLDGWLVDNAKYNT